MEKRVKFQKKENEKDNLKGVESKTIPEKKKSNKNLENVVINNQTNELNDNKEETDIIENPEEKPKKMIEIKPRETYLKDKINKLNYNNNLLSGINKGIDEQLKSVRKEISSEKVLLKDLPKNVDKYINKSFEESSKIKVDDFNFKKKCKSIKDLKIEKDILNKKLMQIIENENLLENKNGSQIVEKNLKEKIQKDIITKKNKIIERLENINENIKNEILNIKYENNNKQNNLKNFLDNFERDKEIVEIRAKKYMKERKERNKRIANDLNQIMEKRKKEIEDKDKKEKASKEKVVINLKRQAKEIENKRAKEVGGQYVLYKPYINSKIDGTVKNYLFMKNYQKFLKDEKNLIDKENMYRKRKMQHISNEEIEEFNIKMDKRREEKKIITDKKTEKLLEEWDERKKTIPTYVSPFSEMAYNEINKQINDVQNKKNQIIELNKKREDFSKELKQPHIDKELEQKRIKLINSLDSKNRIPSEKDTLKHKKRKGRIILKKADPSKPSKFSWKLKILNSSENEISIEKTLIRKPKQYKLSMSMEKTPKKQLPNIKIDYLKEIIENKKTKENNSKNNSSNNLLTEGNYAKNSAKKWDKLINKNGNKSLVDNINNAKNKIEQLELQTAQSNKLLSLQNTDSNNIELNQKVSNLIIDSIEAKLSLLNQMK